MTGRAQTPDDFAQFAEQATPALLRTAWLLCGDAELARDIVQSALVKAYLAWPRIRRPEAMAYVRRIVVNERTDAWRRTRHEISTDQIETYSPAVEHNSPIERRADLVHLLRGLPVGQRTVIVLRYYADLSEQQTAQELGISVGAVKSAASRGLRTRRELAAREGVEHAD